MNRYPLNSRTLGSGISVPESYWAATINVIVSATDNFTLYTGVYFSSSTLIRAVTIANFIRTANIALAQTIQVLPTAVVNRVTRFASSTNIHIDTVATFASGLLQLMKSSVYTGVETSSEFTRKLALVASQVVEVAVVGVFGNVQQWFASQDVIETATTNFTSFGEYASSDRYTIVPAEDRDIEVN